ncbi:MAG: hypothetical protein F4Y01_07980, partial [Gammaproteobacteria bacterium]|nr:hypothetical protein [Gammaproteobacteria bacterium]
MTNAFFGPVVAVVRPVVSFITAVVAGILCIALVRDEHDAVARRAAPRGETHDSAGCDHDHDHENHKALFPADEDCYVSISQLRLLASRWLMRAGTLG